LAECLLFEKSFSGLAVVFEEKKCFRIDDQVGVMYKDGIAAMSFPKNPPKAKGLEATAFPLMI
jgi:hypothetical protein